MVVTTVTAVEATNLISEMERYLAVVEAFRAEGCDLQWRTDSTVPPAREANEPPCPTPHAWLERG